MPIFNGVEFSDKEMEVIRKYRSAYNSQYAKKYRESHRKELSQKRKEYYYKNLDECRAKGREYYKNNKEIIKERQKRYYDKNRDRLLEQQRKKREDPISPEEQWPYNLCAEFMPEGCMHMNTEETLDFLDNRARGILIDRYKNSMSLRVIGDKYNLSGERVRQIIMKSLRLLKEKYPRYGVKGV